MKTLPFKTLCLTSLILITACGKAPKEESEGIPLNNDTPAQIEALYKDDFKYFVEKNKVTELKDIVTKNQIDLKHEMIGEDTPLIIAARKNAIQVVEYLVKYPVNLEETNKTTGQTPLMVAVENGRQVIVQILVDQFVGLDRKDKAGDTALHTAIKKGFESIALLLIKSGANVRITDSQNKAPDELAKDSGMMNALSIIDNMLQIAIGEPSRATFARVIGTADLNSLTKMLKEHSGLARAHEEINPLYLLVTTEPLKHNTALQMANLLMKNDFHVNGPDNVLITPLTQAVIKGKINFVNLFLENFANTQLLDGAGMSPLMHAVGLNDQDSVEALLNKGAIKKYSTKVNGKKTTFDSCDIIRAKGKTYKKNTPEKKASEEIKERLDCDFWDWLF